MFTGLVQRVGILERITVGRAGSSVEVSSDPWTEPLVHGESIAVQGACLTVSSVSSASSFTADVLEETLDCTALGTLRRGDRVNLERALRPVDRLGGHFVLGHVDGVGVITGIRKRGRDSILRIMPRPEEAAFIIRKASIAIDGVSLTVSAVLEDSSFEVNIIPETMSATTISLRKPGDRVNLETDILGKYTVKLMNRTEAPHGISSGLLESAGFTAGDL